MSISSRLVLSLTIITAIAGGLLELWNKTTIPLIHKNREMELQKALHEVLPEHDNVAKKNIGKESVFISSNKGVINSIAFTASGAGYQSVIKILVAMTPGMDKVLKITVLEQTETPGLGTKIVTDTSSKTDQKWFTGQFSGILPSPDIILVKNTSDNTNEVSAITGATITSRAVVNIINFQLGKTRETINEK